MELREATNPFFIKYLTEYPSLARFLFCTAADIEGNRMKYVIAIIKPFKLEEVREALGGLGIQGITVTEVKGHGRQRGHTEFYRGAEYTVSFVPKVKLELAVDEAIADRVIETIQLAGQTGQIGDGKIFILPLEQAVRIRTGETGAAAL
jgi:nitrogen regulatory protein P-II 2